jgi:hypothetical protein
MLKYNPSRLGIAFFGTPHQQEQQGLGSLLENTLRFFRSRRKMREVSYGIKFLLRLNQEFQSQVEDYLYISFYGENDQVS